jgi:hypothetical protein
MAVVSFYFCLASFAQGQEKEEITLTTYYPAPYGTYDNLTAISGLIPPTKTTTERDQVSNAPSGSVIYNTTKNKPEYYDGSSWQEMGASKETLKTATGFLVDSITYTRPDGISFLVNGDER